MTAMLYPTLTHELHTSGLQRELDVLQRLESGLPPDYAVYHSVEWQSIFNGQEQHGEIDIIVLSPGGNMMLIEVKAGPAIIKDGELFKVYAGSEKNIGKQSRTQHAAMVSRLTSARIWSKVLNCIVLPDYDIPSGQEAVAAHRDRIIDASQYDQLAGWVNQQLAPLPPVPDFVAVSRFLGNLFEVEPRIDAIRDQLAFVTERISDGLATWVPKLSYIGEDGVSRTVRVEATAGSGKTQLAVRLLTDAAALSKKVLYLCFNRPLADVIRLNVPVSCQVATFHEHALEFYRKVSGPPDYSRVDIFTDIEQAYLEAVSDGGYDLIVVDEAQDFIGAWVARIHAQLNERGAFYVLGDEAQRLYEREPYELVNAISVHATENYRSPKRIVDTINALGLADSIIQAKGAYAGDVPDFLAYATDNDLIQQTCKAIQDLLSEGFSLNDIAVVTYRGAARSKILANSAIGEYQLRKFVGRYDAQGEQIWSQGDVMADSVYRFKGQSAPAVILTEVDFTELTDQEKRKLFVAMTRVQLRLKIILSLRAQALLEARIQGL